MTQAARLTKQILVAVVFFLIVGGLGFLGYRAIRPAPSAPTPNPTVNLAPPRLVLTKLLSVENNDYDFVAKVFNPNSDYGSASVEYEIRFLDTVGNQISRKVGSFYILPGQTRYLVVTPLRFQQPIASALMTIGSVDWLKLDPLAASGVSLVPRNFAYNQTSQPGVFGKVGGSITNNSNFDLNKVEVAILLFDQGGLPIAANRTEILTFLAKTSRGFEVTWFAPFVGQVGQVEVEPQTNVFENSNFLRQYERQERFQQFY